MSKKVLVISTSLRNGSNSHVLASEFAKGARDARGDETAMDGAVNGLQGFIDCFKHPRLGGMILRGVGLEASGDIGGEDKSSLRITAYEMGNNV